MLPSNKRVRSQRFPDGGVPVIQSFDSVAHVYDETRGLPPEVAERVRSTLAGELRRHFVAPRLLEIGIGTGRIALPVGRHGVVITGLDASPQMLLRLLAKEPGRGVVVVSAERPPFRDGSFDAVLFVHTLHLAPDPAAAAGAAIALLVPGGLVLHGSEDEPESVRTAADRALQEIVRDLCGIEIGSWAPYDATLDLTDEIVRARGGALDHAEVARWQRTTRARDMLDRIARQDFSSSWKIPPEALPSVLERAAAMFEGIFGGLDNEVAYQKRFLLSIGRLPGHSTFPAA
jgi:ubiquinone/menaquinone biosynthesis C-methylase UbiE